MQNPLFAYKVTIFVEAERYRHTHAHANEQNNWRLADTETNDTVLYIEQTILVYWTRWFMLYVYDIWRVEQETNVYYVFSSRGTKTMSCQEEFNRI